MNKNIPCLIPIKDSHVSHNLQHNFLTDQLNNTPLKHFPSKNFTDCIHLWIRIIKIKGQIFFFFRPIWSLRKIHLVSVVFGISYFSKCLRVESIVQELPGNAEASLVLFQNCSFWIWSVPFLVTWISWQPVLSHYCFSDLSGWCHCDCSTYLNECTVSLSILMCKYDS